MFISVIQCDLSVDIGAEGPVVKTVELEIRIICSHVLVWELYVYRFKG